MISSEQEPQPVERKGLPVLLLVACALITLAGLKLAGSLLVPILFGVFLAIVSFPMMRGLERKRVPHILALSLTVAMNIAVFVGIIGIGGELFSTFRGEVGTLAAKLGSQLEKSAVDLEETLGVDIAETLESFVQDSAEGQGKDVSSPLTEGINSGVGDPATSSPKVIPKPAPSPPISAHSAPKGIKDSIVEWARGLDSTELDSEILGSAGSVLGKIAGPLVGKIASWFSTAIFVLIVMIFSLHEGRAFQGKIRGILKADGPDFSRFQDSASDIQRYLRIKMVASILTGSLAGLCCALLGVKYAALWGLVAFLLNFIPVVGSIFAGVIPVLIAIVDYGYLRGGGVAACYLLINFTIGNFLEPSLLGRRFGLSTLVVITSVFFWGWMWGPLGMFLAVPLTMMAKVVFDNSDDFRWLSVAMGKGGRRRLGRKSNGEDDVEEALPTDAIARSVDGQS